MNNSTRAVVSSSDGSSAYYFSAISFSGLVFNSLIIVIVCARNVIPGKIPRIFFLNELIGQWFCCLFRSFAWLGDQNWPVPDNAGGSLVCTLFYTRALYLSFVHATYSNIVLMSIERYMSVIHPMKYRKLTAPLSAFLIFLSWVTAPARLYARYMEVGRIGTSCIVLPSDNRVSIVLTSLWGVVIPVTTIACLNARVIYMLKRQADKLDTNSNNAALNRSAAIRRKLQREMTYSVSILCLAYSISVLPSMIATYMIAYSGVKYDTRSLPFLIIAYIQTFFFVINPLIFMLQMNSLRRELVAFLRCQCIRGANVREEYDVTTGKERTSEAPREAAYVVTTSTQIDSNQ